MGIGGSRIVYGRAGKKERKKHYIYIFHAVALLGKNDSLF